MTTKMIQGVLFST